MNVLIVEDDIVFANVLTKYLSRHQYRSAVVSTVRDALDYIRNHDIQLILLDYHLPDGNGFAILDAIKMQEQKIGVLFMTNVTDIKIAVQAIKKGAIDYITKPINQDELLMHLKKYATLLGSTNTSTSTKPTTQFVKGESPLMKQVYQYIDAVAPTQMNVLLIGETGTGKEHIARWIHEKSDRSSKSFVAVDCGALSKELASSELFGHVKGAFTGAVQDKIGYFQLAQGGTIFLDEIGNLSYEIQIKLLRAIQEKVIYKTGDTQAIPINVRIIAATNEDFKAAIHKQSFREDLYHRINEFQIQLPPLRERKADLDALIQHFITQSNQEFHKTVQGLDSASLQFLHHYHWPGNIRELQNTIRRAVLLATDDYIHLEQLPVEMQYQLQDVSKNIATTHSIKDANEQQEKAMIIQALLQTKFNKSKAAKLLSIDRSTLYAKMNKYGITDE